MLVFPVRTVQFQLVDLFCLQPMKYSRRFQSARKKGFDTQGNEMRKKIQIYIQIYLNKLTFFPSGTQHSDSSGAFEKNGPYLKNAKQIDENEQLCTTPDCFHFLHFSLCLSTAFSLHCRSALSLTHTFSLIESDKRKVCAVSV